MTRGGGGVRQKVIFDDNGGRRGGSQKVIFDDEGGRGGPDPPKKVDIIYEQPLIKRNHQTCLKQTTLFLDPI